jgi:hypothetical protein
MVNTWHGGTLVRTTRPPNGSRGIVLVASRSDLFADIVGGMVSDSGFAPAYSVESEPAWLAVTRTHPCIVICDCAAPADDVQRLLAEASVRGVPVLLSRSPTGGEFAPVLSVGQRVGWFTFPSTREAFQATLDGLMPGVSPRILRMTGSLTGSLMGARADAAVSVRALSANQDDGGPG